MGYLGRQFHFNRLGAVVACALCAVLATLALAQPADAATRRTKACKAKHTRTISSAGSIRVFRPTRKIRSPQGKLYRPRDSVVCNSVSRKWFRLYADDDLEPDPVRIAGRYVAAGLPEAKS